MKTVIKQQGTKEVTLDEVTGSKFYGVKSLPKNYRYIAKRISDDNYGLVYLRKTNSYSNFTSGTLKDLLLKCLDIYNFVYEFDTLSELLEWVKVGR